MMNKEQIINAVSEISSHAKELATETANLAKTISSEMVEADKLTEITNSLTYYQNMTFWLLITVFVLAGFVGYYVILKVTPALHSPLMSVSNAISGIVICGAMVTAGYKMVETSSWLGFFAIVLASINIFGGFVITHRMLSMFKKKGK